MLSRVDDSMGSTKIKRWKRKKEGWAYTGVHVGIKGKNMIMVCKLIWVLLAMQHWTKTRLPQFINMGFRK